MSLENILEDLKDLGKLAGYGIYKGFRKPLCSLFVNDPINSPISIDSTLKYSIFRAFYLSSQFSTIGTAFFYPPFGLTLVASNLGFRMRDLLNKRKNKSLEEKVIINSLQDASPKQKISITNYLNDKLTNFYHSLKLKLCTLGVMSVLALGHYGISEVIEKYKGFNESQLNVNVRRFNYKYNNKDYEFYILGEAHLYNYSSSAYVKKLIEDKNISMLLCEGVKLDGQRNNSWRSLIEYEVGVVYSFIGTSSGHNYKDPWDICLEKQIQPIPLEKIDQKTKGRQGMEDKYYVVLGITLTTTIIQAPLIYFAFAPARYFSFPKYLTKHIDKLPLTGIIDNRNHNMVEEAIVKLVENPDKMPLIGVGQAHVKGMLDEFAKQGKLTERPLEFQMK